MSELVRTEPQETCSYAKVSARIPARLAQALADLATRNDRTLSAELRIAIGRRCAAEGVLDGEAEAQR